jgi:hypothetical protein
MTNRYYEGLITSIRTATLLVVEYDLGFGVTMKLPTQLIHPSTGEPLHGKEPAYGKPLKEFVSEWRMHNMKVFVNVTHHDREYAYGTVYPYVHDADDMRSLNATLMEKGYTIEVLDKSASRRISSDDENAKVKDLIITDPYDEAQTKYWMPRKSF